MPRQFSRYLRPILLISAILALASPSVAGEQPYSQGRLWRVEAPGVAPSFLLGTMHSADPAIATPWPALADVMNGVDSITVELVLDEAAAAVMGQAMMLDDGRALADIAGPARMARIDEAGARYGMPGGALQPFRPWAVNMIFSVPPSELRRQATGASMLDTVLREHGEARGIPVYGIETVDEQIALFADYDDVDQLALLDITLDMQPRAEEEFSELRSAWLAGDLGGLYDVGMEMPGTGSTELMDEFTDRLIRRRNHRMAERIGPRLEQGNALIAVGALHLPGEEGVLSLLARQGYRVSPME